MVHSGDTGVATPRGAGGPHISRLPVCGSSLMSPLLLSSLARKRRTASGVGHRQSPSLWTVPSMDGPSPVDSLPWTVLVLVDSLRVDCPLLPWMAPSTVPQVVSSEPRPGPRGQVGAAQNKGCWARSAALGQLRAQSNWEAPSCMGSACIQGGCRERRGPWVAERPLPPEPLSPHQA